MGEIVETLEKTSGWLKLATAAYYCGASMAVQFANKVSFARIVEKDASHKSFAKEVTSSLSKTQLDILS